MPSEPTPRPWRVGVKVGRTIYRGDGPDDLIGVMDRREDAALVVACVNATGTVAPAPARDYVVRDYKLELDLADMSIGMLRAVIAEAWCGACSIHLGEGPCDRCMRARRAMGIDDD